MLAAALLALAPLDAALAQANGVILDAPEAMPFFALETHRGGAFTQEDLKGGWTLVMLGFTQCPDVCPFTLANLEAVIAETTMRVRPDNVPRVVFLSVDPVRDRDVLREYVTHFHPDFLGVIGPVEQIDRLVEATDSVYRHVPRGGGDYEVQHSSAISVFAPDGTLRAKLQPPMDPGATARFLARLQADYRRETES
jgi:protein SCO1/2